jgi:transketolase
MPINTSLHLAENIFDRKALKGGATRQGFGKAMRDAGEKDERIVGLSADLTESTQMSVFAEAFPERFVQVGVAEQNLVTVASGMAAEGKIPFASSFGAFSPGRNWEQIRTTICYNEQNVKLIATHTGLNAGPDGATHQILEDVALMRVLPNMVVIVPAENAPVAVAVIRAALVTPAMPTLAAVIASAVVAAPTSVAAVARTLAAVVLADVANSAQQKFTTFYQT